jgi:hypothetical protein
MFGPRLTTIFASRWRAMWFSASVLLLAYCTVPAEEVAAPANEAPETALKKVDDKAAIVGADGLNEEQRKQLKGIMDGLEQAQKM